MWAISMWLKRRPVGAYLVGLQWPGLCFDGIVFIPSPHLARPDEATI
jgi:hypothetical protein